MLRGRIRLEIAVKQRFKPRHHVTVGILTGDELTIIEPHAVVQQQFDLIGDKRLAMLVNRMLKFSLELSHALRDGGAFLLRQVQSLIGIIGEI